MRIVGFAVDDEAMARPRIENKAEEALKGAEQMHCDDAEPFLCDWTPSYPSRHWKKIFCHLLFATLIEQHACRPEVGFSGYHGPFD